MPYYAVKDGRNPGVYSSWSACEGEVKGYSGAKFQKFSSAGEARAFVDGSAGSSSSSYGSSSRGDAWGSSYGGGRSSGARGSRGTADVYTDGCCHSNGRDGARAGVGVYWGEGDPRNVSKRLDGRPTNNRAEIEAAREAIGQAKGMGYDSVKIHTDSKFLIDGTTKWMDGWKRNDWKTSTGEPVKNRADFEALDREMKGMDVQWEHVRGHQGNRGNERADRLANEGAAKPLYRY